MCDQKIDWLWNEFQQVGTDYNSPAEVAAYDNRMRNMRDIDGEIREIWHTLDLPGTAKVLEIGTGTGAFARYAAHHCAEVTASDISSTMLEYAAGKAKEENLNNLNFVKAGFLSFRSQPDYFDAVVSGLALHHLPDAWKCVALKRIHRALKPGGRFFLSDVVFDWGEGDPQVYFEKVVDSEQSVRPHLARHIACEYSTTSWIMREIFNHCGFVIEKEITEKNFLRHYCVRKTDQRGGRS